MMAYERLEPFGPLAEEFRIGQVAAVVANVNRSAEQSPVYSAADFMPALHRAMHGEEEPAARGADLDPEELSALIDAQVFGRLH